MNSFGQLNAIEVAQHINIREQLTDCGALYKHVERFLGFAGLPRVTAQSGAFLLFGRDAKLPETGDGDIAIRRVRIARKQKSEIIRQLDTLAINGGTAFRDIATYAEYIKTLR